MNQNKTTSAGKWSVAVALIPIAIVAGLLLLVMVPVWTGNVSGEGGLGVMVAMGFLHYYGSYALFVTGLLGAAIAVFAICRTKWQKGVAGLLLNMSVFLLAGSYLAVTYHRIEVGPDRLPDAVRKGDCKTVERLLNEGWDINRPYHDGTLLNNAAAVGHMDVIELLLSRGADVKLGSPIAGAALNGHEKVVKLLLDRGADPNWVEMAIRGGHLNIAQMLLDHGANINKKIDSSGRTVLQSAVEGVQVCSEESVRFLLQKGANPNISNDSGETPLHVLVSMWPQDKWTEDYRAHVISMLLDAGADIEAKTRKGQTPLSIAAEAAKSDDAMKVLSEHGANLANVKDLHLRFAAVPMSMDIMATEKWVSANTSDINALNVRGESLLHWAVKGDNSTLIEVLLDKGAAVNVQDKLGDTPLHWAVRDPNLEIIKLLLHHKANTNIQNKEGQTPLHILTRGRTLIEEKLPYQSQVNTCELLLASGAKVNIKDNRGYTALSWQECLLPQSQNDLQFQKELLTLMRKYKDN